MSHGESERVSTISHDHRNARLQQAGNELRGVADELGRLVEQLRRVENDRLDGEEGRSAKDKERDQTIRQIQRSIEQLSAEIKSIKESTATIVRATQRVGGLQRAQELFRSARRTLFSRRAALTLHPIQDVRPQLGRYNWLATGPDAAFELRPRSGALPTGWARVRFELEPEDRRPTRAVLYVDDGNGYVETSSKTLPRTRGAPVEALVLLPAETFGLRFDPTTRRGAFRLGSVTIEELSGAEVLRAMVRPYVRKFSQDPRWLREGLSGVLELLRTGGIDQVTQRFREKALGDSEAEDYLDWVAAYDTLTDSDRDAIRGRIAHLPSKPLMSVVMPVYNPPPKFLRRAIDSVRDQLYENWELCIADDASTNPEIALILAEYSRKDHRIRHVLRSQNGHISAASNTALEMAKGEFVVLMDHDDELPEHALYYVQEELNAHPDAVLIYSDEDKIDEDGNRFNPHFKTDWNPDLFYSYNMVSHLGVYRTDLIRAIDGFRVGYEGSQDYDLALRVVERVSPERIRHIPRVLYHWRAIRGSTALNQGEKSYAEIAARKAIQDHFVRTGVPATVEPGQLPGFHRVRYRLPDTLPLVSIIIPTRDGVALLRRCVSTIVERTIYSNFEIIVVDNGSTDQRTLAYFQQLQDHGTARVLRYPGPFNYSAINNAGVVTARGQLLAFLNNDLEVITPDWLSEMVSHAIRPEIGAVGAKLYFPDDTIQHAGVVAGMGGVAGSPHRGTARSADGYFGRARVLQCFSAVTGACLLLRRETFETLGGFNEVELPVAFNDVDLCLRIRERGLRVLWTPYAELYHFESATRGPEDTPEKQARFLSEIDAMKRRHPDIIAADPYYNPNLSLDSEEPTFASPPRLSHPWISGGSVDDS